MSNPLLQALQEIAGEKSSLAMEHLAFALRRVTKEREQALAAENLKGKKELLNLWFGDYLAPEVKNTLALLAEEGILESARKEVRPEGLEEIKITTAKQVKEETKTWIRKELREVLGGGNIIFREDPELLGGIKIKAGDKELENSLRQRLAHI